MKRLAASLLLSLLLSFLLAPAAQARGVWDPDDTRGRLDIRWIGVRYTDDGAAILTVTLYQGFRKSALPKASDMFGRRHLEVQLDNFTEGVFYRKLGNIRMSYGDHGSNCCLLYRVKRPNPTTLRVKYDPIDEDPPGFRVFGRSTYGRSVDETDTFRIGPPPE